MQRERRVTLRCLIEDLNSGWRDVSERRAVAEVRRIAQGIEARTLKDSDLGAPLRRLPRLNRLNHPLVEHFENAFSQDGEHQRQNIGSLSNPHWWKQKTSRWRGAATDHSVAGGGIWLCAGGMRVDGSPEDFYSVFKGNVEGHGPGFYLPAKEDEILQRVEAKNDRLDAWKAQVVLSVNVLLANAVAHPGRSIGPLPVTKPSTSGDGMPIADVSITLEKFVTDGGDMFECILDIDPIEGAEYPWVATLANYAQAAIEPAAEEWRFALRGDTAKSYVAVLGSAHIERAVRMRAERAVGNVDLDYIPEGLRLGVRAHFASRTGLTQATVEGSPVEAMCGYWFVPIHDHEALDVCADCAERREALKK